MTYEEAEFLKALQNWMFVANNRPKNGVYPGLYVETKEVEVLDNNGFKRRVPTAVPSDEQALDYRAWKVYCYWRGILFSN